MRTSSARLRLWILVAVAFVSACSSKSLVHAERETVGAARVSSVPGSAPPPSALPPTARLSGRLIAWARNGDVALVDPATGGVLASAPAAGATGLRDVAFDRWASRLVIFVGEDDGDGGEIATLTLGERGLGPREHMAWIDGDARVFATPFGVAVFEESYGARWRLLGDGDVPSAGHPAPLPLSIASESGSSAFSLRALVAPEGAVPSALALATSHVGPLGLERPVLETLAGASPPTSLGSRLVDAPVLSASFVVELAEGEVLVRPAIVRPGSAASNALRLSFASPDSRLEQAVALDGGRMLALLLSGPARLILLTLGKGGIPRAAAVSDLPGEVRLEPRFFSRELEVLGSRLFCATTAGVVALDASQLDGQPVLTVAREFRGDGLVGPLGVLPAL